MSILVVDVGNTNIVLGCMEGETTLFTARFSTDRNKTEDEYAMMLVNVIALNQVARTEIEGAIVASVVPMLRRVFQLAIQKITGFEPLLVGCGLKTGLNIRIDNPAQLGSDLVVNAVAACNEYQKPILIFDMGTATTLSVVDANGDYLGGMIIPGMQLSMDALSARASHLPNISFDAPEQLIGTNTVNCMQAGAVYGHAAILDGVADRVEDALGMPCTVVATGGLAPRVTPFCRRQIICDETLMLRGLALLYEKNKPRK